MLHPDTTAQTESSPSRKAARSALCGLLDALGHRSDFFGGYNNEHHHGGRAPRAEVLVESYAAPPERFLRGVPMSKAPPTVIWMNAPRATRLLAGAAQCSFGLAVSLALTGSAVAHACPPSITGGQ
ncbi:hypothetical protein [Myxococcus xanthus]|uniref:hypothetical protein n=1 Tax=Myxococcus xanthus TaxID=34 RepID=UPI0011278B60|nr:hypothetical protein [Myxococcus xanthus]QDF00823.1 hypothetical protein BHS05_36125 [Myxococcus xanthus]